ncbi:MAG: efflux RND transporter periplasmic adaptor subunit [Bacteroidales bacterium]|jgi:RND family efflux transporter MFP subunit|nr:efflux RND transporter periplasmic adaptor subunit [Bacteroidales bacterium]
MKKIFTIILVLTIISSCKNEEKELNKDISVPVSVVDLSLQSIEKYIETTGTVFPVKEAEKKAEISGNYQLLINPETGKKYALGDYVKKDEKIIRLEDQEYENNIKINSLKLSLEIAQQVYDKQQSLYDKGGVTLSELKNAEIEYINAEYNYKDALLRLGKMDITAPFAGVIVDLPYYTQGTRTETGATMFKLMDYSKLYMEVNLAEKDIKEVKPGQKVHITNYTLPEDTLSGRVAQISPAIDADTRSFKTVIDIQNPDLRMRPGMFAKGKIIVASVDSTLVIPKNIILSKQRGNTVFVVEKGLAQERVVTFGLENPDHVQIISGLEKNERIVVKGFETLRNRSKVKVIK